MASELTRVTTSLVKDFTLLGEDLEESTLTLRELDIDKTSITPGNAIGVDANDDLVWVSTGATVLGALTDVDVSSVSTGDAIIFDGSNWVSSSLPSGAQVINDLSDVSIATEQTNEVLLWDGASWTNDFLGIEALSEVVFSSAPSVGDVLTFDGSNWIAQAPTGDVNGATNLGTGTGVFTSKNNNKLEFKSINAASNIAITNDTDNIFIEVTGLATVATSGDYNDLLNLPSIPSIIDDLGDVDTTSVAPTLDQGLVWDGANWIPGDVGETNTASNLGAGEEVFAQKNAKDLEFRSVVAGSNVSVSSDATSITISAVSGVTQADDLSDVSIAAPITEQLLVYNGSTWTNITANIDILGNVDTSGVIATRVLKYDGSDWIAGQVDYSEITNTPTLPVNSDFSFAGLNDTNGTPLADGILVWDGTGSQVNYTTTLSTSQITGLATVATSGDYNDLLNLPSIPSNIEDLNNVDTTGVSATNVLKWTGTQWIDGVVNYSEIANAPVADGFTAGSVLFASGTGDITEDNTNFVWDDVNDELVVQQVHITGDLIVDGGTTLSVDAIFTDPIVFLASGNGTDSIDIGFLGERLSSNVGFVWDESNDEFATVFTTDASNVSVVSISSYADFRANNISVQGTLSGVVLDELDDVNVAGPTTGHVVKWNGSLWIDGFVDWTEVTSKPSFTTVATTGDYNDLINTPFVPSALDDLSDVNIAGPLSDNVLKWSGTEWTDARVDWTEITNTPTVPSVISDLGDVNTAGASNGQVLTFDGAEWIPGADSSGLQNVVEDTTPQLGGHLDVNGFNITSASGGDITIDPDSTGEIVVGSHVNHGLNGIYNLNKISLNTDLNSRTPTIDLVFNGTGTEVHSGNAHMLLEASATATSSMFIEMISGNSAKSGVIFTDTDAVDVGRMEYDHSSDNLRLVTSLGRISLNGILWPTGDGSSGQVIATDGAGSLSFVPASSISEIDDLSDVDTTSTPPVTDDILLFNGVDWVPADSVPGNAKYEEVVFRYTAGSSGDLSAGDAIVRSSSGISVTILDGANSVVEFSFSGGGYKFPPASLMTYGQSHSTNQWNVRDASSYIGSQIIVPDTSGNADDPDLIDAVVNTPPMRIQLRMEDTGASADFGQRAYLYVRFLMSG